MATSRTIAAPGIAWLIPLMVGTIAPGCTSADAHTSAPAAIQQSAGAIWTQQTSWRLSAQPVLQIEGADADIERAPVDPVSVFRLGTGRYVVADGDQRGHHALLVYDARGRFVMRLGRKGRGPGEFGQLFKWGGTYRGDSIAAYDFIDHAIEIFAPDGKHARALKLPDTRAAQRPPQGTYGASDYFIGPLADGRVLRFERAILNITRGPGPAWYEPDLALYDADGANPRKLATLRTWGQWWDGKRAVTSPLQAVAITVAGKSNWYHGAAEDFSIGVFDSDGRPVRTLRRPLARQRVSSADREAAIRSLARMLASGRERTAQRSAEQIAQRLRAEARFPEFKPAYVHMVEDSEGNLWVQHYGGGAASDRAGPQPSRWSIFDTQGRFMGELEMPALYSVSNITNDQVLGFWQDEFDVKHVRVYGLVKPQNPGR